MDSEYEKYKKSISTFWSNILHEHSKPLCKKVKKKRRPWEDFTINEGCQNKKKGEVRKKRRISIKAKSASKKGTTSEHGIQWASKATECELKEQAINSTPPSYEESILKTPVYIMEGNKSILLNLASADVLYIKLKIREVLGIPVRLQMLTHKGNMLVNKPSAVFEPYDNIHISIRGRGGMKNEESTETNVSCAAPADNGTKSEPNINSSEEEVTEWMKKNVKLVEEVWKEHGKMLASMNGRLLFYYDNEEKFASDAEIPIGVARKILYAREAGKMHQYQSPKEIKDFVSSIKDLGIHEDKKDKLCEGVINNYIDGFNFQYYQDENEFCNDLKGIKIPKMCLIKILQNRIEENGFCSVKRIKIMREVITKSYQQNEKKIPVAFEQEGVVKKANRKPPLQLHKPAETSDGRMQREAQKSKNHASAYESDDAEDKDTCSDKQKTSISNIQTADDYNTRKPLSIKEKILKRKLLMESKNPEEPDKYVECKLKIAMHSNWKTPNTLEKKVIFFVITKSDELKGKKYKGKLWKAIIQNRSVWEQELNGDPGDSDISDRCQNFYSLMDIDECSLEEYANASFVFVVSYNLLREGKYIYKAPLSDKTEDDPFYFSFTKNKYYLTYDSADCTELVRRVIIEDNHPAPLEEAEHHFIDAESNQNSKAESVCSQEMEVQFPRKFKADSRSEVYKKGSIFYQPEDDGTLSERCFEFKLFEDAQNYPEKKHVKFQKEVLRFACGCLNRRVNGTIYFGISDQRKRGYKNGEIVGFHVFEGLTDVKTKYSDELRNGIRRCFYPAEIAEMCISNPYFISTIDKDSKENIRVVMEVDIEPTSKKCGDKVFSLNLHRVDPKETDDVLTCIRKGSSTIALDGIGKEKLRAEELPHYLQARKEFEAMHSNIKHDTENRSAKLKCLLTFGDLSQTFDVESSDQKYICRILISSKPSNDLKQDKNFKTNFSFLKFMHFAAVFDFDDSSNEDGICFHFRNLESSEFVDDKHFQSHMENFQALAATHNVDRKTIWIFANGSSDFRTPHLQGSKWESQYYREITAAISFFQLPSVIPPNRIMFVFLLLSNEFDGILDTFHDIKGKFGWNPIVIVSNAESTFRKFSELVIKENKGSSEELEKHSVVDMPWDHVNRTILQLIGKYDTSDQLVLSSSGTPLSLSNNFIRSCTDLDFLGLDECENVVKDMDKKSLDELEKKHQLSFYKGKEVTWWNFYFKNQVCPRQMYLESIKEKIKEELKNKQNEASVVVLTIAHEAGSGATTLARNILWDFRKDKVRCCLLKKITDRTVMQLMQFWRYGEDKANKMSNLPILVLIDCLIHIDLSFFDFIRNLKTEFRKVSEGNGVNCLALICQREDPSSFTVENDSENIFTLRHRLNEDEKQWFWAMFKELEAKKDVGGYEPKYLISFMIMRDGFNKYLINQTFEYLLYSNDIPVCERELIKFVAFLSAYTPSARRLIKVYIPVQCCDTLMGKSWWENKIMSSGFQIVLNIKKTNTFSNEHHVEMGYPYVAMNVLETIMSTENEKLAKIAMDFFETFILNQKTHGNDLSMYFLPMLKERKFKDKYRSRTAFSPLIESILKTDFEGAVELLRKSFNTFADPILAQTLARVYLKRKRFEEAIDWAKQSVSAGISTPTSCSFCLHTYGVALREKFNSRKESHYDMGSETTHLELLLQSLEKFVDAQNKRDPISKTYEAFHDTIFTINIINKFLMTVNHGLSIDEFRLYLVDKEYIPEKIDHPWEVYHGRLKGMKTNGERAMDLIDEIMCFYSSFDVQDSRMNRKNHRLHVDLHEHYKEYLTQFSYYYGQHDDTIDKSLNPLKQDAFHRGRILALHGRSYKTIFDKVTIINTEGKKEKEEEKAMLKNIRHHVNSIKEPTTTDLIIKVCVNVALGITGCHYSREEDLIKICRSILRQNGDKIDLACMFLCMLMWPFEGRENMYQNDLFNEALQVFQHKKTEQRKKLKDNKTKENTLVMEKHICQPTITFFQGKIHKRRFGIKSLYHRSKIFVETSSATDATEDLLLVRGIVREDGYKARYISVENKLGDDIKIYIFRGKYQELRVGEKISFHLGFSVAGPVAYNMRHDKVYF